MFYGTVKSSRWNAGYRVPNIEGKNGQLRVAIYCRVSTHDQDAERQRRDLWAFADRCGYFVVGLFAETGSGVKVDRTQRQKVTSLAKARSIDGVLVTELTRWGRSTIDLIQSLHELQSYGVGLIAQDGLSFDMATPHGRMMAGIMSSLAEFERDLLRERVASGLALARARGKVFGRPAGGKTADNCEKIKGMRAEGKSIRSIALEIGLSKSAVHSCCRNVELPEGMDF
jgi:putative DNA-invertase from lambdoid prophage Rac